VIVVGGLLPPLGWAILAALLAHEAVFVVRHLTCKPAHCKCPLPHKFLAGIPLHGQTVTDATYWRKANTDLTQSKTVGPFLKLPGWKRRAYRTGPVIALAALLISPVITGTILLALLACLTGRRTGWGRSLWRWLLAPLRTAGAGRLLDRLLPAWLRRPRHRNRVQTMGMLLGSVTGTAASVAEAGIKWAPDYADTEPGEHVARWILPRGFKATGGEKKLAEDVWKSRVGLDLVFSWNLAAAAPYLDMTRARKMPTLVYLNDVLDQVEALPEDKTAIGLDDQGNLVCWDWGCESPHGLLNAGSRHGKTETEEGMVCQVLHKGGVVTYVDVKRVSIQGLKGLPGLTLCDNPRDMEGIWLAIGKWGDELDRRIDERTKDPTIEFCRNLLVLEEVNQFSEMCDEFWESWPLEAEGYENTILWKTRQSKRTPPIWRVVKKGVWEGAFAKQNVLIAGQNIEAQTVRGVRNSIGLRLLGGYQPQNWKALVGTTPVPPAPPVKGRWCLINGSTQTWVQAILADLDANTSAAIWRDYARAGRRLDGTQPAGEATVPTGTVLGAGQAVNRPDLPKDTAVPVGLGQRKALKLSTMLEQGLIPGMDADPEGRNLANLRKWSQRWDDWPERRGVDGPAHTFYPDEVAECVQRHRQGLRVVS